MNTKYFVYLGCSGFPYGLAEIQKMILISKSLVVSGNSVTIICKKGTHKYKDHTDLKAVGDFEGIDYVYSSGTPFRSNSFIKRNFLKIKGIFNEYLLLKKKKRENQLDYAIISTNSFYSAFYYFLLSKLCNFKTILNYVEYYSDIKKKWYQVIKSLSDKLYDKYIPLLFDANFPISEFLITQLKKKSASKPYLKIPVLTDLEKYNNLEIIANQKYFLFCGSTAYKEIIIFIIGSYIKLSNSSMCLYLIINGDDRRVAEIKKYIYNTSKKNNIRVFSKLSEKKLYTYYKNAAALLIPLRPILQDIARFPHKIGEYLASGNPVISTNYGEVKHYFKDKETMLIADIYDEDLFSTKMQYVIDNPLEAQKIGKNGKNFASNNFDYRIYGEKIVNFLNRNKI